MSYFQVTDECNGCMACIQNCPANALMAKDEGEKRILLHNMALCARCATCWRVCPQDAIQFEHFMKNQWDEVAELEMVYCYVCQEPLYTARFNQTLTDQMEKPVEPTCEKHKLSLDLMARAYFFPGGKPAKRDKIKGENNDSR